MLRRKLGELFIKYRVRSGRGAVFTAEIQGLRLAFTEGGVILIVINQYFHVLAPLWIIPLFWLLQKAFEYFAGWYDEKYLGWHRAENNFIIANTNPFLVSMDKKIDEVLEEVKK